MAPWIFTSIARRGISIDILRQRLMSRIDFYPLREQWFGSNKVYFRGGEFEKRSPTLFNISLGVEFTLELCAEADENKKKKIYRNSRLNYSVWLIGVCGGDGNITSQEGEATGNLIRIDVWFGHTDFLWALFCLSHINCWCLNGQINSCTRTSEQNCQPHRTTLYHSPQITDYGHSQPLLLSWSLKCQHTHTHTETDNH